MSMTDCCALLDPSLTCTPEPTTMTTNLNQVKPFNRLGWTFAHLGTIILPSQQPSKDESVHGSTQYLTYRTRHKSWSNQPQLAAQQSGGLEFTCYNYSPPFNLSYPELSNLFISRCHNTAPSVWPDGITPPYQTSVAPVIFHDPPLNECLHDAIADHTADISSTKPVSNSNVMARKPFNSVPAEFTADNLVHHTMNLNIIAYLDHQSEHIISYLAEHELCNQTQYHLVRRAYTRSPSHELSLLQAQACIPNTSKIKSLSFTTDKDGFFQSGRRLSPVARFTQ